MEKERIMDMTDSEHAAVLALYGEMSRLIDMMIESFGFESQDGTDCRGEIMAVAALMKKGLAELRPELMADFNAVFDKITMVYYEPERFFGFMDDYRDSNGVIQLNGNSIGGFYGKTMACLSQVKSDFNARFADIIQ
ncbi:MAG: hypothetical protein AB7D36_07595 [Oscillospiraceae bacterium]